MFLPWRKRITKAKLLTMYSASRRVHDSCSIPSGENAFCAYASYTLQERTGGADLDPTFVPATDGGW